MEKFPSILHYARSRIDRRTSNLPDNTVCKKMPEIKNLSWSFAQGVKDFKKGFPFKTKQYLGTEELWRDGWIIGFKTFIKEQNNADE